MDAQSGTPRPAFSRRARGLLISLALASALSAVFYLYSNPQLVIMLTDTLWACF